MTGMQRSSSVWRRYLALVYSTVEAITESAPELLVNPALLPGMSVADAPSPCFAHTASGDTTCNAHSLALPKTGVLDTTSRQFHLLLYNGFGGVFS